MPDDEYVGVDIVGEAWHGRLSWPARLSSAVWAVCGSKSVGLGSWVSLLGLVHEFKVARVSSFVPAGRHRRRSRRFVSVGSDASPFDPVRIVEEIPGVVEAGPP